MAAAVSLQKYTSARWWSNEASIRSFSLLRYVANSDRLSPVLNAALNPFNPFDPARAVDPYPGYEALRAKGPVFHHRRMNTWIVTGFAECEEVLRSETSVDRTGFMFRIPPYRDLQSRSQRLFSSMLLLVDPPDHTRMRRLVSRAFTPRAVNRMEPEVEKVANQLLDSVVSSASFSRTGSFDVMAEYASKLPIYMIGELLGISSDTWPRLKEISDVVSYLVEPIHGFDPVKMDQALEDFAEILEAEFEARRREPRDDVLSVLVSAGEDGDRLTNDEMLSMCALLMVAGHETTTSLIGNAILALDEHRGARQLLLEQPSLAANAVEEFLRYDSPVQTTDRIFMERTEIGGYSIPGGSVATVLLGAANRDPRLHDEPASLKLSRKDPRPLSFGHGIHLCVGAALARLEARVAIPAFVERFPNYTVERSGLIRKRSVTLRGPVVLPVQV